MLQLVESSAVIVARNFNPPIVDSHWLIENHLLEPNDFEPGCIYADMIAQVRSREFDLLVTADQLQFRPKVATDRQRALLVDKVGGFVNILPHTPYKAVGLNFHWRFVPERVNIGQLTRQLFFVPDSPLYREFDGQDARFGGYMSRDLFDGRLRLEAKPVAESKDQEFFLLLAFNLHRDIGGKTAIAEIQAMMSRWDEVRMHTSKLANAVAARDAREEQQ